MLIQSKLWRFYAGALVAAGIFGCGLSDVDDDDDAGGAVCAVDADDTDCDVCIKTGCCDAYTVCQDDPACSCILNCANENQTKDVCADRCGVTTQQFANTVETLGGTDDVCSVQCTNQCAVVYGFYDVDD